MRCSRILLTSFILFFMSTLVASEPVLSQITRSDDSLTAKVVSSKTSVQEGEYVLFYVRTYGGPTNKPLKYQWFLNDQPIEDAVKKVYEIRQAEESDDGKYTCQVTADTITVMSSSVTLTVNGSTPDTSLVVTINPESLAVKLGETAELEAEVTGGEEPYKYQWFHDGTPIVGADEEVLQTKSFTKHNVGKYTVAVVDANGLTKESEPAYISLVEETGEITIVRQPKDQRKYEGQHAVFYVRAYHSKHKRLRYEWYKDDELIEDANRQKYVIYNVDEEDEGSYSCRIFTRNEDEEAFSESAELEVIEVAKPLCAQITPRVINTKEGEEAVFNVRVKGGRSPYTYVWYHNYCYIPGSNDEELVLDNVQPRDHGYYYCYVRDADGRLTRTNYAKLRVRPDNINKCFKMICVPNPVYIHHYRPVSFYLKSPVRAMHAKVKIYNAVNKTVYKSGRIPLYCNPVNRPFHLHSWYLRNKWGRTVKPGLYTAVIKITTRNNRRVVIKKTIVVRR